jgi:hypothetical protein
VICSVGTISGRKSHFPNAYFEVSGLIMDSVCLCITDCLNIL